MSMKTTVKAVSKKITRARADALVLFTRPEALVPGWLRAEEPELAATLDRLAELGEITGEAGNHVTLHCLEQPFCRVILVGIGPEPRLLHLQNQFADMVRAVREKQMTRFAVALPEKLPGHEPEAVARALAEAAPLSCYVYHKFMGTPDPAIYLQVEMLTRSGQETRRLRPALDRGLALGKAVVFSRDLCNLPANVATPGYMAETAKAIAERSENLLKVKVLGPRQLEKEGMNLFRAVSAGSTLEPRMICLDYTGDPERKDHRVALVGKCITFDAGGISIKPSKNMMHMKRDKMGGTNVLGLASVMRYLRPKLNVSFVVAAAENMPAGNAYRPGDCYRAMNGKWVEIVSTDAEGRLVMADSLTWVQKYRQPSVVLDMATLTGGAEKALGGAIIAGLCNDEELWESLEIASRSSGEALWRLPLFEPYRKGVRSYFAETKNSSTTPPSTIKAGLFLEEWIDPGVRWAHLDLAAAMQRNRPSGIHTRGATGIGLRLTADLLAALEESRL